MEFVFVSNSTVKLEEACASDISVARAAWVSNIAKDAREKDASNIEGLINFLYRNRHMSPFEHGMLKFYIECPIFVAREFMRHRTFSYNEMSGRYMELPPRFYLPPRNRPLVQQGKPGAYTFTPGTSTQMNYVEDSTKQAYENAWGAYKNMMHAGVAKEVARNVLPVGTMTQFYVTGNPRNWMQFLSLRDDKHALYEIREVAQQIAGRFEEVMPLTYAAYKKYDWRDTNEQLDAALKRVAELEAERSWYQPLAGPSGKVDV